MTDSANTISDETLSAVLGAVIAALPEEQLATFRELIRAEDSAKLQLFLSIHVPHIREQLQNILTKSP